MTAAQRIMVEQEDALFGPPELQESARTIAEASATGQGLPPRVVDRAVIERIARLARHPDED
jgi:hypothetical protein